MKYFLTVLAMFKNEKMIIKEWIEHYLWQGVEHFYLIDNGSDDDYLEIIQDYIDKGLVTLYILPERYSQAKHYNTVLEEVRNDVEWMIVCDIDEYFYGVKEPIKSYLNKLNSSVNMVGSYWLKFGSNGLDKQPNEIRKSFTKRKMVIDAEEKYCKSIFKVNSVHSLKVHIHIPKNGWYPTFDYNNIRINHYQIMSKEYYEKIKMTRGDSDREYWENLRTWEYFNEHDTNEYEDLTLSDLVKNGYKN